jgi:predicted nucleic acid-binding protein
VKSSAVPLCAGQRTSHTARETYRTFSKQVVAWTTLIEATGAIHRAARLGGLSQSNAKRALDRLGQLEKRWIEIMASERVRAIALDVLRTNDLRAGDAIQLASALVWCKEKRDIARSFVLTRSFRRQLM